MEVTPEQVHDIPLLASVVWSFSSSWCLSRVVSSKTIYSHSLPAESPAEKYFSFFSTAGCIGNRPYLCGVCR